MKIYLTLAILLFCTSQAFAADQQPSSVVELFTSQGCSSCPAANEFVSSLAADEDKLVLTYGVTYWDYLGWTDTFADAKYTLRQREYGHALGVSNVYTPQIILNGSAHSPRYSRGDVESMVLSSNKPKARIDIGDDGFVINSDMQEKANVVLVHYIPGDQKVAVGGGENSGRTLTLTNVVTNVTPLEWSGTRLRTGISPVAGQAYAAIFQDAETAKIVTTAKFLP